MSFFHFQNPIGAKWALCWTIQSGGLEGGNLGGRWQKLKEGKTGQKLSAICGPHLGRQACPAVVGPDRCSKQAQHTCTPFHWHSHFQFLFLKNKIIFVRTLQRGFVEPNIPWLPSLLENGIQFMAFPLLNFS